MTALICSVRDHHRKYHFIFRVTRNDSLRYLVTFIPWRPMFCLHRTLRLFASQVLFIMLLLSSQVKCTFSSSPSTCPAPRHHLPQALSLAVLALIPGMFDGEAAKTSAIA